MVVKKTRGKAARVAVLEYKGKALAGKVRSGRDLDPTAAPDARAPALAEVNEPRPYTSRYPIPDAKFQSLKDTASRAKLVKKTAVIAKDSGGREELAALTAPPNAPSASLGVAVPAPAAPTGSTNFAGISATGWIPPDCTMAVGPDHVLLSVNSSVAIYKKTGGPPLLQRTLTQWYANLVQGLTIFDPKTLYDQQAGRWVLLAVAVGSNPNRSLFLLSVSATANPQGPWRNYSLDATLDGAKQTNNWADFPALGVDNQAFYLTSNMFQFGGGFQYAKIRIVPKAGPYAGGAAPYFDFVGMKNADNTTAFTIQPCHTFGAPQVEYLVNSGFPGGNFLTLWKITNPLQGPTLTRVTVPVSAYALGPNADQPGGATPLNTGDVRALHAIFRGDSVWTALTTAHNWGAATPNRAAVQWFQIRAATGTLVQQGVYGAADGHYFYPACCPDNNGNMILVFSRSGTAAFGSVYYTGRKSTDPLGTLQASALLKAGVAQYVALDGSGRNRWGDYNGVAADPANQRVVWFHGEFTSAVNAWATWVGSAFF